MMRLTSRRTLGSPPYSTWYPNRKKRQKTALNKAKLYLKLIKHSLPISDTSQRPTER